MFTFQTLYLISALLASSVVWGEQRLFAFTETPGGACGPNYYEPEDGRYDNTIAELISIRSKIVLLREPDTGRLWEADITAGVGNITCTNFSVNTTVGTCEVVLLDIYLNCIDFNNDSLTTNGFGYHYLHIESMQMQTVVELQRDRVIVLKEVNNFQIQTKINVLPESAKPAIDSVLTMAIPAIFKDSSCVLLH